MVPLILLANLIVTVLFGFLYGAVDGADEKSFGFKSPLDPFYFSFTTMSTVGYGDYAPKTDLAKYLVMLQQGILIGEIVSVLNVGDDGKRKIAFDYL